MNRAAILFVFATWGFVVGGTVIVPEAQAQPSLRIRKNVVDLSAGERQAFVNALFEMKNNGDYDPFVDLHFDAFQDSGCSSGPESCAHNSAAIWPWHRAMLWDFETLLLARDTTGLLTGLPYWEWSVERSSLDFPWSDNFLGGDGDGTNNKVLTGPFGAAGDPDPSTTVHEHWQPENGSISTSSEYLQRNFINGTVGSTSFGDFASLATTADIDTIQLLSTYDSSAAGFVGRPAGFFRPQLENVHDSVHVAIGGHMVAQESPDEPAFFLHHNELDRQWWRWQTQYGIDNYLPDGATPATTGPTGTNLDDTLEPFGVTPRQMLDIMGTDLGYTFAPRLPEGAEDIDVVVLIDTSGSMNNSSSTSSAVTKMVAAQRAALTFVDLIETTSDHRIGIVEFNTTASESHAFIDVPADKTSLEDAISALSAGGATSIGAGLNIAQGQLAGASTTTNTPFILLMTDGIQNTAPLIDEIDLDSTRVNVLGFGSAASLDGQRLSDLAEDTGGVYARAPNGLALQKLYVASFGDNFLTGTLRDPFFKFDPNQSVPNSPFTFDVTVEDGLVVVLGWERPNALSGFEMRSPSGAIITETTPGVTASSGPTWAFFKVSLPLAGDDDGEWEVFAERNCSRLGETCPSITDRFFISAIADGGPILQPLLQGTLYSGDSLNPLVTLRDQNGERADADITVEITRPLDSTGNLLQKADLQTGQPQTGDPVSNRFATLTFLEEQAVREGQRLIPTTTDSIRVFDDTQHEDGVWGPDGVYGNPQANLRLVPGTYGFHAFAVGTDVAFTREAVWSIDVEVGIDPAMTDVQIRERKELPDGRWEVDVEFTPRDVFGNYLGTGRLDVFTVDMTDAASKLIRPIVDTGTGSYIATLAWNHVSDLVLTQPDRDPINLFLGPKRFLLSDLDQSGAVDVVDFGFFAGVFGLVDSLGDLDRSGGSNDVLDFGIFAGEFGKPSSGGTSVQSPEPSTMGTLLVLGGLLRRRSRRS